MKLRRRDTEIFSLSFMDCICCGFGAIILLLVLTEVDQPIIIERARQAMDGQILRLQKELFVLRGETDELNRELQGRITVLRTERTRLVRLVGDLTNARGEFSASNSDATVSNIVENELVSAYQELTAEMERLLKQPRARRAAAPAVGGIPIDSEYVVFVIDTSNSMVTNHWETTNSVMKEILDIYPKLKGMQVINDQGRYMFENQSGKWLTDSPELRDRIRSQLPTWTPFSRSNPVPGIELALRQYRAPGLRLSIYVIGDEFTGAFGAAVSSIARLNAADGKRPRARIHAIGFLQGAGMPPFTNVQFSALMRAVSNQNNGTFVGLTNEKACRNFVDILGVRQCVGR
jgi:hypothetical protein